MKNSIFKATLSIFTIVSLCFLSSCGSDESSSSESENQVSTTSSKPAAKSAAPIPTTADVKFKMEVGEVLNFTLREEIDMTEQNQSRITRDRIKYWFEVDFLVECIEIDKTDGAYIVVQEWINAKGADSAYKWDVSKHLRAPDYLKRWRRLIGQEIKLAIMPNGEIGEIWNGDVLADAILYEKGVNKRDYSEKEMPIYERQLESMLDSVWESKENMFPSLPRRYPEKLLKPGNVWITAEKASSSREGYLVMEMELAKVKSNTAYFDTEVSVRAGDDPTDGSFFAQVSDSFNITGDGKVEVDLDTGLFKKIDLKADVTYDAEIDDRLWQNQKNKTYKGKARTIITMKD